MEDNENILKYIMVYKLKGEN